MKKSVLVVTYFSFLSFATLLHSCQDDPIVPNGAGGSNVDTTWIDSTGNGGNNGGTNPNDTLGGGIWGGTPGDTLGGGNPNDTIGGGN